MICLIVTIKTNYLNYMQSIRCGLQNKGHESGFAKDSRQRKLMPAMTTSNLTTLASVKNGLYSPRRTNRQKKNRRLTM